MTKIVYQIAPGGMFVGTALADESPREPGVYLIPAGCIEVEPPSFDAGQLARWTGEAWVIEDLPAPAEDPAPTAEEVLAAERAGMVLTDIQFAMASASAAIMTFTEAEAWVARGELPALALAAIAALPAEAQPYARIRFAGARTIERLDPFMPALQAAASLTDEQVDDLFRAAASL